MAVSRRGFGAIRKLPSGRYQASYIGPDARRHPAETTFTARIDAEAWLARRRDEIQDGVWPPGRVARSVSPTLAEYAATWLEQRELKPRTRAHYRTLLERFILPSLGSKRLREITSDDVTEWHHALRTKTGDTYRAHAYSLLRAIYRTAQAEDKVTASPCRIRGAGQSKRKSSTEPATLAELEVMVEAMPANLRAAALVAAWAGLRFGELFELRRRDIDLNKGIVRVRRGVVRTGGAIIVGDPKSAASKRDVALPPHILPMLAAHIAEHAQAGRDGLIFPGPGGVQWSPSSLYWHWHRARAAAGRQDLRWHDLRHTGAVLAAQTGATLKELMSRLGHSTPAAALRYQHVAAGRDAQLAERLSELARGG